MAELVDILRANVPLALFDLGNIPAYNKAAGVIAAAEFRAGVLICNGSTATVWKLPTMYRLGFSFDPTNPLRKALMWQNVGAGTLFINPAVYRGTVASQAAMLGITATAAIDAEDYCIRADLGNQAFIYTGPNTIAGGAVLANWQAVPTSAANAPVVPSAAVVANGPITWNSFQPQGLPQLHPVGLLQSYGLDLWVAG